MKHGLGECDVAPVRSSESVNDRWASVLDQLSKEGDPIRVNPWLNSLLSDHSCIAVFLETLSELRVSVVNPF